MRSESTTWLYEPREAPLHREGLFTLGGSVKIAGGKCGRDYCYSPDSTLKKSSVTKREHNRMLRLQSFALRGEPERKTNPCAQFSCSLFVKPRTRTRYPGRPDIPDSPLCRQTRTCRLLNFPLGSPPQPPSRGGVSSMREANAEGGTPQCCEPCWKPTLPSRPQSRQPPRQLIGPRRESPSGRLDFASRRSSLSRLTGAAPRENDWEILVTFVVQRTVAPSERRHS